MFGKKKILLNCSGQREPVRSLRCRLKYEKACLATDKRVFIEGEGLSSYSKESAGSAEDLGSIPGLGRPSG